VQRRGLRRVAQPLALREVALPELLLLCLERVQVHLDGLLRVHLVAAVRWPEELGLSQGDIIRVLGDKSRNAVSNIEVGIEGLPAKRAYAWADVLEVPRDAFFRVVTGEVDRLDEPKAQAKQADGERMSAADKELLATYGRLPPKYQRRLREHARELEVLARAAARKG
jgi:hypothetical protein